MTPGGTGATGGGHFSGARGALKTVTYARGISGKAAVAEYFARRMASSLSRRHNITFAGAAREVVGLRRTVVLDAPWGRYLCRQGTSDAWVAGANFEPSTIAFLRGAISEGTFVDVGGYIGRFAIEFAHHLRVTGDVIVLEPQAALLAPLRQNISLNALTNIQSFELAAWSSRQVLCMQGSGATARGQLQGPEGRSVAATTLDELILRQLGRKQIRALKIDVEGDEAEVLVGAEALLDASPEVVVVFEALDPIALEASSAVLRRHGLKIQRLSWKNYAALRPTRG